MYFHKKDRGGKYNRCAGGKCFELLTMGAQYTGMQQITLQLAIPRQYDYLF